MVDLFSYPKRKLKNLVKEGEYKEALEFGKSLEKKFSKDADYFFIMGGIYYILDDAKNALYYFDKGLNIDENDVEAILLKANIHLYLKEKQTALDCCEKVLKIDSNNKSAQQLLDKIEESYS